MSTGAASAQMSKQEFITLTLDQYLQNIEDSIKYGKFDYMKDTPNLGNDIMKECIRTRNAAVNPGQQPDIGSMDTFTIIQVLSKTNAAPIKAVTRAEYHEKLTRTIGLKLNHVAELQAKMIEMEEKVNNQANNEEVINKRAEVIKGTGTRS